MIKIFILILAFLGLPVFLSIVFVAFAVVWDIYQTRKYRKGSYYG